MTNLPEEYDRVTIEEENRVLLQKIDDLKTQSFMIPLVNPPVGVEHGTLAYSDGTISWDGVSPSEGLYRYTGSTWTKSAETASPAFTGTPTAPTAGAGTNTTQVATTAFVSTAISSIPAASDASTSVKGIVQLATAAEIIAGTDATKALTPSKLLRVAVQNPNIDNDGGTDNFHGSLELAGVVVKWGLVQSTSDDAQEHWFKTAAGDSTPGEPSNNAHKNPFPNFGSVALVNRLGENFLADMGVKQVTADYFVVDRKTDINNPEKLFYIAIGG